MNQTNNRAVLGKAHFLALHICSFLYNKQTKNLVTTKGRHLGDTVFFSKVPTSDCKMSKQMVSKAFSPYRTVGTWGQGATSLPPTDFGRSINPIQTREADYSHKINTCPS